MLLLIQLDEMPAKFYRIVDHFQAAIKQVTSVISIIYHVNSLLLHQYNELQTTIKRIVPVVYWNYSGVNFKDTLCG